MIRDPIGEVPKSYVVHRIADTWLVMHRDHASALVPMRLADADVREKLFASAPRRGRGATPTVQITPTLRGVLRRYRHGGLLGAVGGTLYWGPRRAMAELCVTARALEAGAPVPEVLVAVVWPVFGPFWSALLGTREEPRARQLGEALGAAPDRSTRRALVRAVAKAARRLHDAGVDHKDLQLANVLCIAEPDGPRIVVIDLDRAVFHGTGRLAPSRRAANLGRFFRSVVKTGLWNHGVARRDVLEFAAVYLRADRELREVLERRVGWERCKLAMHRLGYALSGAAHSAQ